MRLVIDLLACQTNSRFRGIGRYSYSVVKEMALTRGSHQVFTLANNTYQECFNDLRREFTSLLPARSFLPYQHPDIDPSLGDNDPNFAVASTLVHHAYETLTPDFILYPSIFEGWGEKGVVALPRDEFPSSLRSVIVYDFIPYIFADHFIDRDPYFKQYYLKRLNALKKFDLLLAISESTRQDSIRILNMPPEQVVNISAAASPVFHKKEYSKYEIEALFYRFGITKPFVFYTGNVEYHKNMEMALKAYSQLPLDLRRSHQLVLTHTSDETSFRSRLRLMDLSDDEVVITGHISDQELVALYNSCRLYIFPSLYEGFGLPILEAMACGAPVIASNNSSIPEVIGREDAMFDASNEESITHALYRTLTNENFLKDLSAYGLNRVKQFSWQRTAQTVWSAMEEILRNRIQENQKTFFTPVKKSSLQIAYVSPLPPDKTGIADYSADLLPYLSRYVNIDLFTETGLKVSNQTITSEFKIYPWTDLLKRRDDYDTVVYQVGNSKYHSYMFELLKELPGIVVLHDFYLSHIREYLYSTHYLKNNKGDFLSEVAENHGLFASIDFIQRGVNQAIWDWPDNWSVLKYAQKIIVHSNSLMTLMQKFYQRGWYPKISVIKQLHLLGREVPTQEILHNKQKLGISPNGLTVCSFGFLNPTKLNLVIIEAFAKYLSIDKDATLIFVGEIDKSEYAQQIERLIDRLRLTERVKITGFVENETFNRYLSVADVAIQLRINSRGETSRAVLDCMAYGIPTIINAYGTLNDYNEESIVKLDEVPTADALYKAIVRLFKERDFKEKLVQNARNDIQYFHNPEKVASDYFEEISKASKTNLRLLFTPLVDAIATRDSNEEIIRSSSLCASSNLRLRDQSRILIDVSNIAYTDLRSGIQRVVKNLIRGLFDLGDPSIFVELIKIQEGKLYRASRFAEKLFSLPEESLGIEGPVVIKPGDTLFMLDTSWNLFDQFRPVFDHIRRVGGRIYTMVYDLIPLKFPEFCTAPTVVFFRTWIEKAIAESDEIICISKAVLDEVKEYLQENRERFDQECDLSFIHLGSDIPVVLEESNIRAEVRSLVGETNNPLFLMVGTIEPRKGHAFALDAFEILWRQGDDYRLCILGKVGWNVEMLEQRILAHPELGKRLFFFGNATDAEINFCYSNGTALIASSIAEGFGLPIVEAALHQVPTLASDIPVFREIGGEGAVYFSLKSPDHLAEVVKAMAARSREERRSLAKKVKYLSWKESAEALLDILERKR